MPKPICLTALLPCLLLGFFFPKDAPWRCFPGKRALTLGGKGLVPQSSPPGPQKPTLPELHPGQMCPLPRLPQGSLHDGCVPFTLALMKGG